MAVIRHRSLQRRVPRIRMAVNNLRITSPRALSPFPMLNFILITAEAVVVVLRRLPMIPIYAAEFCRR